MRSIVLEEVTNGWFKLAKFRFIFVNLRVGSKMDFLILGTVRVYIETKLVLSRLSTRVLEDGISMY